MEAVVVGGGNNNSLPILRALRAARPGRSVGVVNCDPHADFRRTGDGRHSGNPFSFANEEGILDRYCVLGLQEQANNEDSLVRLDACGFPHFSFEAGEAVRGEAAFSEQVAAAVEYAGAADLAGCELDMDVIENMPTSAQSPVSNFET